MKIPDMAEQDMQTSDGELPADSAPSLSTVAGEEEGVDGEIDETEETHEQSFRENSMIRGQLSSRDTAVTNKDAGMHHTSSDHRRHRHHISSHRDRRRRASGRGGMTEHLSDNDGRSSNGRLKQRPENLDESFNPAITKSSRLSGRKHDNGRGNHSHVYPHRSKQSFEDTSEGWLVPAPPEHSMTHTKDHIITSKKMMKENRGFHRVPLKGLADKGEAEDGEILEDGELSDYGEVMDKRGDDASTDVFEVSTSKSSSRDKNKDKSERKKSDHKGKRNHETDTKRKKRKNAGMDILEGETNPAPAWGSGYQGSKKRTPEFCNREQRFSTGTKGYQSPPGLYDSPSYSENSDEESIPKALMTEGYIDASVAADEKEGIFNHKVSLTKKNKRHFERNDYKRGRNSDAKYEGPPKKKALFDMSMSERPACRFYLEGKCAKGNLCQFNHDVEKPKKMEVCKYHLTVKGCIREKCQYMHKDYPCKYYHTGAKCYSGDKCKFSHDPLTEETRRALEMRVAAEDIIDMEDPDYNYGYDRPKDTHNKPSLLGSPPRFRPHGKKIPSLFEIEVHPPGQSSKASPQTTRPSGFYSETNASPNAGMELNSCGGTISSPNMGMIGSSVTISQGGQHGFSNQANVGNPGLLQVPVRPNIMMNGPTGNGRPIMMMGNQQGTNLQQQRLGGGTPIQFLGPGQMNTNNQQPQSGNNLPPVLNMLGAIIREAAMQKGSGVHNNNINMMPNIGMGLSSIRHNMNNMVPNMNNMGPNNMQQENINMGPNNNLVHNSIPSSNANSLGPMNICLNMMGSMGPNSSMGNIDPNSSMGNMGQTNMENTDLNNSKGHIGSTGILGLMGSNISISMSQQNMKQDTSMDVDYRVKQHFEEMKEESQDLLELDKIRQQIQAQIDREDEGDGDMSENMNEDIQEEPLTSERPDADSCEIDDLRGNKDVETEAEHIEIPSHLPKKQRELFKRIQQQQLLREKEWERQEALKATHEDEAKAELDDWYSSDEDDKSEKKPKLTDVLKKLNKDSSTTASVTPVTLESSNTNPSEMTTPSSASTFNIMQMINTIKSQSAVSTDTSKLISETGGISMSQASTKLGESRDSHQLKMLSSASSHPVANSFTKLSDKLDTYKPNLHLPALTVDPPVVSALPVKSLAYAVIKISFSMPKPYTKLPGTIYASDPAFKDDPRVKWHLNYLEKVSKESQRKESSDEERPQKQSDPRLKRKTTDPRLAQTGDSPINGRGVELRASDLSLHRTQVSVDPRLARLTTGNLDPRLNRQNSQNNQDGVGLLNNMGGMMSNQMAGSFNLLNGPMRGDIEPMSYMGGSTNNTSGLVNNLVSGGMNIMAVDSSGMLMQCRGDSMNNTGLIGNNMGLIRGQGNQMGPGPDLLNRMKGLHETGNALGDLGNSNVISFQGNNMMRGHLGQQNPLRSDSTLLESRMNSSSDPRLRNQKRGESQCSGDPRLKNRALTTREQLNTKELVGKDPRLLIVNSTKDEVFNDTRAYDNDEFRSFPSKMKGQGDLSQSSNYLQSDATIFGREQIKISHTRDGWVSNTDHRIENDKQLSSSFAPSSMQYSNTTEKTAPKFDYRNDPRFKRVNRLMGQQKFSKDDSSADEDRKINDGVGETNEHSGPSHSSYISRTSDQDPHSRNTCSPQLPDSLEDFDLPGSPMLTVVEPEPDLKVKDLFKAIDPTASPFC